MSFRRIAILALTAVVGSWSLLSSPSVQAQAQTNPKNDFYTTLHSTYTVNNDGSTYVEHQLSIRNLTPKFFISKYGLSVSSPQITQVKVTSNGQTITPAISKTHATTHISIEFSDKIVGKDKVRNITIAYQNPDAAQVKGKVLEVNIPRLDNPGYYDQKQAKLVVPAHFGLPKRISPANYQYQFDGRHLTLSYDQLSAQGVTGIFGDDQFFDLTIRYHLQNPSNQAGITQISLPPDTPRQKIVYRSLNPKPKTVKTDIDGNWIATYFLPPNQTIEVDLQASVMVAAEDINPHLHTDPQPFHTKEQKFWPVNSPQLQELAAGHKTPKQIYDYTVDTLNYTEEKLASSINRMGAKQALANPDQATCQEFTDLFITLARANNIPARRITGFAYSENPRLRPLSLVTDVLHTWPEYYDRQQEKWIQIDPTWGHTTGGVDYFSQFDLNHIAFAINGRDSELPYPAGAYKLEDKQTKDIDVQFLQEINFVSPHFEMEVEPVTLLSLVDLPGFYQLKLTNKTGQAWYLLSMRADSSDPELNPQLQAANFSLLPYETKTFNLNLYNRNNWLPKSKLIKIKLDIPGSDKLNLTAIDQEYEFELLTVGPVDRFQKQFQRIKKLWQTVSSSTRASFPKIRQAISNLL